MLTVVVLPMRMVVRMVLLLEEAVVEMWVGPCKKFSEKFSEIQLAFLRKFAVTHNAGMPHHPDERLRSIQ